MIVEHLNVTELLYKGDYFLEYGKRCKKIGQLTKGILRGYILDSEGNETTTHFFQEGDMIIGSYIPNVASSMSIQALENSEIIIADYITVMSLMNKDQEITNSILSSFHKMNNQIQSRLVTLLQMDSVERYKQFLIEYPTLIDRVPHYYIANFLGISPTQLSRARKQLQEKEPC